MAVISQFFLCLVTTIPLVTASASFTELASFSGATTYRLGYSTYYAPRSIAWESSFKNLPVTTDDKTDFFALTTLKVNQTDITADVLSRIVTQFGGLDDVWSPAFLDGVIIQAAAGSVLSSDGLAWLEGQGTRYLLPSPGLKILGRSTCGIFVFSGREYNLATGPYLAQRRGQSLVIREAYFMKHDKYLAFTQGVTPVYNSTAFEPVEIYEPKSNEVLVPVPSRLYSLGDTRPLAGLRMAVKDLYHVEGVQTGGGSRVYAELHPESNITATSVAKLVQLGAVIIVSLLDI